MDPGRLSAGERQLIGLARSYLAPGPVMVLDEATCHLDPPTEADVEAAFRRRPDTPPSWSSPTASARPGGPTGSC